MTTNTINGVFNFLNLLLSAPLRMPHPVSVSSTTQVGPTKDTTTRPRYLLPLVLGTAALVGAVVPSFIAPKWSASVLVRIGQTGTGAQISTPQSVVQRIKFDGFAPEALKAAALSTDTRRDPTVRLVKKTLNGKISTGGSFVELSVQALSPDDAKRALLGALSVIQQEHAVQLAPTANRLKKNLEDVNVALNNLEGERKQVLSRVQGASASAEKKFSENVLLSGLVRGSDSEIRALIDQRRALEEQLDPSKTYNTQAATPVFVPDQPSRPSRAICSLAGLMVGLLGYAVFLCAVDLSFRTKLRRLLGFDSTIGPSHTESTGTSN